MALVKRTNSRENKVQKILDDRRVAAEDKIRVFAA